jgi:hypothetical protein
MAKPLSTLNTRPAPEPFIHTVKEMATALNRSEDYVGFMKRGGFELPATLSQAVEFIRKKGPPSRFRLYSHRPSCRKP